jgi:hypothetical protein
MNKITNYFSKSSSSPDISADLFSYVDNPEEEVIQDINLCIRMFPNFIQTIIASVSLGTTRVMMFENKSGSHAISLIPGSLCLIMPPTNDKWTHSIAIDKRCVEGRISIIFRYYE